MKNWEFLEQNPWWQDKNAIARDPKILDFENNKIKWIPPIFNDIQFVPPKIYTIRGPRQVGKTTLLKLLIRKLINGGTAPKAILYYSLDFVKSYKEFAEIYRNFKDIANREGIKKTYIFFDEISSVIEWQKALKYLADIGLTRDSVLILTGSSSIDLKKGAERMPGRRGGGRELDKVLMPISFREYLQIREPTISLPEIEIDNFLKLEDEDFAQFSLYYRKIQAVFEEFAKSGGFPKAVNDFVSTGSISNEVYDTFLSIIVSDIEKLKMNRTILKQVMRRVYEVLSSRWSWQSLAKGIDVGSFHTVKDYVETLADSFILSVLYFWDYSKKKTAAKKEKKIYLIDPLIYQIFANASGISNEIFKDPSIFSKLVENIVFSHLVRVEESLYEGLSYLQNVFYWYSSRGNEIDFLVYQKGALLPIEVKYQSEITVSNYATIKRAFNQGIVLTKDAFFKKERIFGFPVSVFLSLMKAH